MRAAARGTARTRRVGTRPAPARAPPPLWRGWRDHRLARSWTASCSSSAHALALAVEVIDDQVLAEVLRADEEGPPLIDARHLVDEVLEIGIVPQHEDVDGDALARRPMHLAQRLQDRDLRRRPVEVPPSPFLPHTAPPPATHPTLLVLTVPAAQRLPAP